MRVPLLNFEGSTGVPLLNFKGVSDPGVLDPLLHFADGEMNSQTIVPLMSYVFFSNHYC